MSLNPADLVNEIERLASFPEVALRVSEVLDDDRSSAGDIGKLIEPDPALSAALLRIANSGAYRAGGGVDNVESAVKTVGMREVRDITFAISATSAFQGIPNELISVEDFWLHSLYCACAAQNLSRVTRRCRGVSLFTAGLLHDIGQLVLFSQYPDQARTALQNHARSEYELPICHFEREVFGFDHTEVGEALAERWQFPESLRYAIRYHHSFEEAPEHQDVAMVIGVANSLAVLAELDSDDFGDGPEIDAAVRSDLNVDDEMLLDASQAAKDDAKALLQLFIN